MSRNPSRFSRAAILLTGLIVPQAVLYGPSLTGAKVLLPLDLLAVQNTYLPHDARSQPVVPRNYACEDLVLFNEPLRRFVATEYHAGRLPLWNPYNFAGAPFANFPKYSPFLAIYYAVPSPFTLAWIELLKSILAGFGAFLFFRRIVCVGFWPAAIGAWSFPLTGFFSVWLGYWLPYTAAWLPWVLIATDAAVRRPQRWGGPMLALFTAVTLVSGQLDTAGHVLLASGVYAIVVLLQVNGLRAVRPMCGAMAATAGGWLLGFLLAAPYIWPMLEYAGESRRLEDRGRGFEERPPQGLSVLPQWVLPLIQGDTRTGSAYIGNDGNLLESVSAGYCGLTASLVLAPLGWCSRRHLNSNCLWLGMTVLALGWIVALPGITAILRLPVLNMLSHNRFVVVASFGMLSLSVVGLEMLLQGAARLMLWHLLPVALIGGLGIYCLFCSAQLPEPIATKLGQRIQRGEVIRGVPDQATLRQIQKSFTTYYRYGSGLCGLAAIAWGALWLRPNSARLLTTGLSGLLLGELLLFGLSQDRQGAPALYYPRLPVLEKLASAPPGRILGYACFPPNLNHVYRLPDLQGYDAVDPVRFVQLLELCIPVEQRQAALHYAAARRFVPMLRPAPPGGIEASPIMDMLSFRYLVQRLPPPPAMGAFLSGDDYWIMENRRALSRAFVPRRVEHVATDDATLRQLGRPDFDPREIAYVDQPIGPLADGNGAAEIVHETPGEVTLKLTMNTPGLVVLADLWDKGWRAELNGRPAPILRANHALRGVVVSQGPGTLVFRYQPVSVIWGFRLTILALTCMAGWSLRLRFAVRGAGSPIVIP